MGKYSIKELERLSGIKAHTLRIWEKRYNLFEPNRTDTNIRFYSDEDLKKLLNVTILCNGGMKISKIVSLDDDALKKAVSEIDDASILKQKRIDDLIYPMLKFDEDKIDQLYYEYAEAIGVEKTFTEVIYPFLEKVGILWLTDEIEPAQEHFITHIIRQKISAAIEALPKNPKSAKKVILFLPEGEYHELGLLFFAYLYKKRGIKVYYFGQSTPVSQIIKASKKIKPNWVTTYSVIRPAGGVQQLINKLSECICEESYFIVNTLQKTDGFLYPPNVKEITDYRKII